ncbi:MAG: acetyl-CoA acetyltransferase [Chloroflexota bacterium]
MGSLTRKAAIVGVAESDIGSTPGKSPLELMAQATRRALDDAGLTKDDIDGLCTASFGSNGVLEVGEYLQIRPRFCDSTQFGGSSFEAHVGHAAAAIAAGLCETVLVVMGTTNVADRKLNMPRGGGGPGGGDPRGGSNFSGRLYGLGGPVNSYAMAATRHMHQYGTTSKQLAEIAVATRKWATLNPKALMRFPITIEDVLNSPMISYPLHLLDCCLVTDAGGAVIVTTPERAMSLKKKPVWILGYGEHFTHNSLMYMPDLTVTPARVSGEAAFKMAGLTRKDIDVVEVYDSFTITVLLELEDLGFCKKGEGGAFVSKQRTAPGGAFPLNTSGGGLSYTHPGMYGIFLLIEAARQLRGECGERQVKGAKIGLANGCGGALSSCATVIMGSD